MGTDMKPERTAVIAVDVQGDFTEAADGSLAVPGTDQAYLDKVADATKALKVQGFRIIATRDYHPRNHVSFYTRHPGKSALDVIEIQGRPQVLWPPHCVQKTPNADVLLDGRLLSRVIPKGTRPDFDSYSGFYDDGGDSTGLKDILTAWGITDLIVYGLATDYCVRATVMDAVREGFRVVLLKDLCRGVARDTIAAALAEMETAGVGILDSRISFPLTPVTKKP